jgi:hypothetical protein
MFSLTCLDPCMVQTKGGWVGIEKTRTP